MLLLFRPEAFAQTIDFDFIDPLKHDDHQLLVEEINQLFDHLEFRDHTDRTRFPRVIELDPPREKRATFQHSFLAFIPAGSVLIKPEAKQYLQLNQDLYTRALYLDYHDHFVWLLNSKGEKTFIAQHKDVSNIERVARLQPFGQNIENFPPQTTLYTTDSVLQTRHDFSLGLHFLEEGENNNWASGQTLNYGLYFYLPFNLLTGATLQLEKLSYNDQQERSSLEWTSFSLGPKLGYQFYQSDHYQFALFTEVTLGRMISGNVDGNFSRLAFSTQLNRLLANYRIFVEAQYFRERHSQQLAPSAITQTTTQAGFNLSIGLGLDQLELF